ncbi:MAG: histidinol-phosphatase [Acutalibacteraceae bacterium]|nr:histidinol-phosphatase [Acutalibacteraceae bacterium]
MIANYHTHTFRCGHATGTEEEYIKRAIEGGLKIFGFADHAPAVLYDGYKLGWRVQTEDAKDYFDTIKALREKYKDTIKIYIGFEMEYYPQYFDKMYEYVKQLGAEYLILGQHFIDEAAIPHSAIKGHNEEHLIRYTNLVIEGMETGKFLYVAHPDMLNYSGDMKVYESEAYRLCSASKELDIPLEINLLGIYDNRHYPNENFLKIAGQVGCKMIYGFDAHTAERAYDSKSLAKAEELVKKYNINLIDYIEIKS